MTRYQKCNCGNTEIEATSRQVIVKCTGCGYRYVYKAVPPAFVNYLIQITKWILGKEEKYNDNSVNGENTNS